MRSAIDMGVSRPATPIIGTRPASTAVTRALTSLLCAMAGTVTAVAISSPTRPLVDIRETVSEDAITCPSAIVQLPSCLAHGMSRQPLECLRAGPSRQPQTLREADDRNPTGWGSVGLVRPP